MVVSGLHPRFCWNSSFLADQVDIYYRCRDLRLADRSSSSDGRPPHWRDVGVGRAWGGFCSFCLRYPSDEAFKTRMKQLEENTSWAYPAKGLNAGIESIRRPYRWGYFLGLYLAVTSPFFLITAVYKIATGSKPFPTYDLVAGNLGILLALGILWRKRIVVFLVYVTLIIAAAQVTLKLPGSISHAGQDNTGGVTGDAIDFAILLGSAVYFHKRRLELN